MIQRLSGTTWKASANTLLSLNLLCDSFKTTLLDWLPTLSNIPPFELRRQDAQIKEYTTITKNLQLPIDDDTQTWQ